MASQSGHWGSSSWVVDATRMSSEYSVASRACRRICSVCSWNTSQARFAMLA